MKLLNKQKQAIDFFNRHGYLVVESCRRGGKTVLLQTIIENSVVRKVAVICPYYKYFVLSYGKYKNCKYFESVDQVDEDDYGLVIGDEVLIEPTNKYKTACALTKKYITLRWGLNELPFNRSELDQIKKEMSEEAYMREFGQFEAK